MRKLIIAVVALPLAAMPVVAAEQAAPDGDLAKFRAAYTSGDGLAYVVINNEKGEQVYRYGDASRITAKRDTRGYMLFTVRFAARVSAPEARGQGSPS